ncbi:hypothetical protein ACWU4D_12690 [Vibrio sp. WJH972]
MKNRRFVNLPRQVQNELQDQYQIIYDALERMYDIGKLTNIKTRSISVFDHWLSFDEAMSILTEVTPSMQNEYNRRLHKFICSLSHSYECYLIVYKGRYSSKTIYRKFTSDSAREKTLLPQDYRACENERFKLVIPALGIMYFEGSDFTHRLYFSDESVLKVISEYLSEAEVHLI